MSPSKYKDYQILEEEGKEDTIRRTISPRSRHAFLLAFAFSVLLNVICLSYIALHWHGETTNSLSRFAQLPKQDGIHLTKTPFSSANDTVADAEWEALDTTPGTITLPDEFAQNHGIRTGMRFPWDESQGLYVIKGFHNLHCLKAIRRSFREYQQDIPQSQNAGHILHCLDNLRQSTMCTASDDLIPVVSNEVEAGLKMQCRSWEKLTTWALDPERHACYDYIDEYRHAKHEIERFGFCPESSRYYPNMKEYFDREGHQDPWT
ncbi:uncharacterized protein LY89DRAFT_690382 [Mollisia scopiformis]|uniref:Uncharacterized protein n=1 Tax=Mollisia scopiformis TaxID=149040 RepID=A0A132BCF5_MOLSC|nr:uncharacterized protein LY89DRAFT_690382 [Mollisia scopiformis]KUJ09337.1 hypothetical protein LY89DRAFT_690382 [Mollisia scopiformis]